MSRTIPVPSEPLLTRTGQINPIWWRYLRGLESQGNASGVQEQIREILRRLSDIPEAREVIGRMSVMVVDQPDGTRSVQLEGDSLTPGSNAFYCTDSLGRRQWAALSQVISGTDGIAFTDSGYTVMGATDTTDDLPALGNDGEAWWVGNVLYAWDSVESEWVPDYSPSGELRLSLIQGQADGETLVWDAADGKWVTGPGGGGSILLRVDSGWIEYSTDGGASWTPLIELVDLAGPPGPPGPASSCYPTASFDGGSVAIQVGSWCEIYVPFGFEVTAWTLVGSPLGNIVIDVRSALYGTYPPQAGDSMCGVEAPRLAGDIKNQDSDLSDWPTTEVPSGSVIRFHVAACEGVARATLTLEGVRS